MEASSKNSTAAIINLSTLSQYFIPFGNFIFPIIIWSSKKNESAYIDRQGKNTINFQLSLFLYSLLLAMIAVPIFIVTFLQHVTTNTIINDEEIFFENFHFSQHIGALSVAIIAIVVFALLKVFEFFLIIYASIKTSNGDEYNYPLTIPFIK